MSPQRLVLVAVCLASLGAGVYFVMQALTGGNDDAGHQQLAIPPDPPFGQPVLAASSAPSPTPRPSPKLDVCGPPVDSAYLANNQVLAYYGSPYTAQMGILGELTPTELAARLRSHAMTYDSLNGALGVRPAFHIVYGRATVDPGRNGDHLLYVDGQTMREYIDLACREGFLVFVDLQIGLSDVAIEVRNALPWLDYPNVHFSLDPEFAMAPGEIPGDVVGTVDAEEVNTAQALVQAYAGGAWPGREDARRPQVFAGNAYAPGVASAVPARTSGDRHGRVRPGGCEAR